MKLADTKLKIQILFQSKLFNQAETISVLLQLPFQATNQLSKNSPNKRKRNCNKLSNTGVILMSKLQLYEVSENCWVQCPSTAKGGKY